MLLVVAIRIFSVICFSSVNGFQFRMASSLSRRSPVIHLTQGQRRQQQYHNNPLQQHRHRSTIPAPRLSSSSSSSTDNNDDQNDQNNVVQISQLDTSQIVDIIEVSFIHACLQLSQGYVDILKLFIVACKAAFERRIPLRDLLDQVNNFANQNTAGRALVPEEVTLRSTWMQAVYLMLSYIEHDNIATLKDVGKEFLDPDTAVWSRYASVLPTIVQFRETGKTHAQVLALAEELAQEQGLNAMEQAVWTQTLRVLWYTLVVLSEEALADPSSPPRPNIPGAY